jgi:hypothetical protein
MPVYRHDRPGTVGELLAVRPGVAPHLGARRVNVGQASDASWVVMADPDGNEFDVLRPLTPEQLAAG